MVLGPVWIVAVVLAAAGVGKLARPAAAQPSLRSLRLPSGRLAVRTLGAVELLIAAGAFAVAGVAGAVALGLAYAALTVASAVLRRQAVGAGGAGCGCFGRSSAPVGWSHVGANAAATLLCAVSAVVGLERIDVAWPRLPAAGVGHAVLVAAGAAAVIALLTVLPETQLAARRVPARDPRVHLFGPTIARRPSSASASTAAVAGGPAAGERS